MIEENFKAGLRIYAQNRRKSFQDAAASGNSYYLTNIGVITDKEARKLKCREVLAFVW